MVHYIPHCRRLCRPSNYITESEKHHCRSHHAAVKLGTESVIMQPMRIIGSGSPLRFLGDTKTPTVHICSGALVWFRRGWTRWFKTDRGWERVREREATGCRERRNRECVWESMRLINPLCPGGRLWSMLEDYAPNEDGQQRSIRGTKR